MITCIYSLIADRFLQVGGRTIDLASGEEVWLRREDDTPAGNQWAERCAALYVRRHPQLVELADYGGVGRTSRFEAFRTHGSLRWWPTGDAAATRALQSVSSFLVDHGLSPGRVDRSRIINVAGEPRLLPDEATGLPVTADDVSHGPTVATSRDKRRKFGTAGIVLQPRSAVGQIMDFLEEPQPRCARWLQLRGPSGAGTSTALRLVAREARLRGFVPIATSLFARVDRLGCGAEIIEQVVTECAGRHVILLNDRRKEFASGAEETEEIARCVFRLGTGISCPHLVIVSVSDDGTRSPWVALEPLAPNRLLAIIGGQFPAKRDRAALTRAVRASCGWPGQFLRSLGMFQDPDPSVTVARERAETFAPRADDHVSEAAATTEAALDGWKRIIEARGLTGRGRHAPAVRTYREAIGMFERRGDQLHAGIAWYELGQLLLLRGATDGARQAFERAGERFRDVRAIGRVVAAATGEGLARMEAGQLCDAETILRTADLPIGSLRDSNQRLVTLAALVRCLSWQGRVNEAAAFVERERRPNRGRGCLTRDSDYVLKVCDAAEESAALPREDPTHCAAWHAAAAHLALQRRLLDEAAAHVNAAIDAATDTQPLEQCTVHAVAVSLHGCIGDAEAVRLHAARALEGARAAHAPLEALRLRIGLMLALDQAGARADARALADRMLRIRPSHIPALLNAELGIALARTLPESTVARGRGQQAEAFARSSGAAGLLFAPGAPHALPKPLCDIVDVLRSAQEYEDEPDLLQRVGQLVRSRLGALSVAFVSAEDPDTAVVLVGAGCARSTARAMTTGILVGPLRTSAGIEISAPMRCGGATVGALGCRWSAAGPDNGDHARALIATAAVLSGPFLKAVLDRRHAQPLSDDCPELLGVSSAMADLRRAISRAAAAPFPVLIVGESGVGKELVARAIHRGSPRRLRNLAALNCAALTEELVEAELFGHARGAFTGAIAERRGIFEEADGGTLFLDEVSELSPRAQAKLLRVLQEGEVRRVGESFARHVDVRVVAATNRGLDGTSTERQFRQDLRYRLDVIRIEVSPLRQRVEDIPVLAAAFWTRIAPAAGCRASLSAATIAALTRYDWPGNARELQNVIAALVVASPRHGLVPASALPSAIARSAAAMTTATLEDARLAFERQFVAAAFARAASKPSQAAKDLGISRQGLAKLVKRLGIPRIQKTERRRQNEKPEKADDDSEDVH